MQRRRQQLSMTAILPARSPDSTDVPAVVVKPAVTVVELMAALGREIEPHEGTHQIFNATGIGRIGVEDFASLVFGKYVCWRPSYLRFS